jgi:hypothetical protein
VIALHAHRPSRRVEAQRLTILFLVFEPRGNAIAKQKRSHAAGAEVGVAIRPAGLLHQLLNDIEVEVPL